MGLETPPTTVLKTPSWKEGTVFPKETQPREPELLITEGSSEYIRAVFLKTSTEGFLSMSFFVFLPC